MKEAFKKIGDFFYNISTKLGNVTHSKVFTAVKRYIFPSIALIMLILSACLPFVKLNTGVKATLFGIPSLIKGSGNFQLYYIAVINIVCFTVALAALVYFAVEEFVLKNKKHNYIVNRIFGIALFVLCYLLLASMLCYKSGFEDAGLDTQFMMEQVKFPLYALFICIFILAVVFFRRGKLPVAYIVLITLCIVWLFPIIFIVFTSFRADRGYYTDTFIPENWSFDAYTRLFTDTSIFMFGRWFLNTLFVSVCTCILSTIIIVSTSFVLSRFRFKSKKLLISALLILGMFPGFMSMIAIYYIIKGLGLGQSLFALILCYSGSSAMGYYVVKGFIDTIPKDIDEAAMIDGANRLQIFIKIILPLAKPIIIYTVLTSFMAPWGDYIFASVIMGDNYSSYTVALGLYMMLQNSYINSWYTSFAAGAVLVALPISVLFIALNKYYVEGLSGSVKG